MDSTEFLVALVFATLAGGWIGCVVDRWRRRPPPDQPRQWVESIRMDRLHVIEDEWINVRRDDDD